jgi:hypothetical protein
MFKPKGRIPEQSKGNPMLHARCKADVLKTLIEATSTLVDEVKIHVTPCARPPSRNTRRTRWTWGSTSRSSRKC